MKVGLVTPLVIAGVVATAQVAWPQANSQQSGQQVSPGGASGTGVPGKPGNKSGPSRVSTGTGSGTGTSTAPAGADPRGVKGLHGNKSGPSTREPGQNR